MNQHLPTSPSGPFGIIPPIGTHSRHHSAALGRVPLPPPARGCRNEKKKKTRIVQYALRWRPVGN